MIGNDVVDIALASKQSNWKRPGFLKKIFTINEQSCILNSNSPDMLVWLIWSMKESAYKIVVRQNHVRCFAPLRFECNIRNCVNNHYEGYVLFENSIFETSSEYFSGVIYTIAHAESYLPSDENIYEKIKFSNKYFNTQHKEVYLSIFKKLAKQKSKHLKHFSIKKDSSGVPEIYFDDQKSNLFISISHHGRYGAYILGEYANI
jgi:phosphopantetheinyl transferase (holo-ACP synthase)